MSETSPFNHYLGAWKKYVEFSGRANRAEFWYFMLFNLLISAGLGIIDSIYADGKMRFQVLSSLYSLAVFLPCLAISVRRMHDIGKSGWWLLINLVPLIGWIWFIVLAAQPSVAVAHQGNPPAAASAPAVPVQPPSPSPEPPQPTGTGPNAA